MNAITMSCPSCNATLNIDPKYAGVTGTCRTCKSPVQVPTREAQPTPSVTPTPTSTALPVELRHAQYCAFGLAIFNTISTAVFMSAFNIEPTVRSLLGIAVFIAIGVTIPVAPIRRWSIAIAMVISGFALLGTSTMVVMWVASGAVPWIPAIATIIVGFIVYVFYRASKTAKQLSKQS